MSTVNAGNRKRYFRRNNYGKFYTYRRIRNIMNTYFRAKLSMQIDITWANNVAALAPVGAGNANQIYSNADLIGGASSWLSYRSLFTFYKPRGLLVECDPKFQNVGYFNSQQNQAYLPYTGDIAIGLNNANVVPTYRALVDSNHFLILSTVSKQRVYWPFTIKDFTEVPIPQNQPNALPYWFVLAQNGAPAANSLLPLWGLRLTYYITFRQSTM